MSGDVLALIGIALVVGSGAVWFRLLQRVRIPEGRTPFMAAMGAGALASAVGLYLGTSLLGSIAAWVAIGMAAIFIGLRAQSAQPANRPAVSAGGPMLAFSATDDSGETFDSVSLAGRPYLLKFFRGHW